MGLTKVANQVERISNAARGLTENGTKKLSNLATALTRLGQIGEVRISSSIGTQLSRIAAAAVDLQNADLTKLTQLAEAMKPLSALGTAHLTSYINQLGKLPTVIKDLNAADLDKFIDEITRLNTALTPFAQNMEKISNGFASFPSRIQRLVQSTEKYNQTMSRANKASKGGLWAFLNSARSNYLMLAGALGYVSNTLGGFVQRSTNYMENLNLFTVAMGQYAGEAKEYAAAVNEALGIDMSEWMRNQGIFMQIATGFGVIEEKAYTMSQGLTQIAYDIASFYNISTEDAMQKVQSGISGELEPLRRLGYALDAATLQQVAYNHGIEQSINTMTQAQKSQLRHVAIMEQSENVMGDMARTIMSPANALRVLNMQMQQLGRAIGDMILPLLMKILPYAQAAVMVLTDAINKLAVLFGFELPEIDYSGLGGLESGAEDAEGAIDETTEAVKELKNAMLGIDELNVISPKADASGLDEGAYDLPIDIDSYKFFDENYENQVKKIAEEMERVFSNLAPLFEGFVSVFEPILSLFPDFDDGGFFEWLEDVGEWIEDNPDALRKLGEWLGIIAAAAITMGTVKKLPKLSLDVGTVALKAAAATLTIASIKLIWEGVKALFDDSPENDLLAAVALAIGGALMGAAIGILTGKGLAFTAKMSLTLTAVSLIFAGLKMLFDEPTENDLLAGVMTAIGLALMGSTLTFGNGKGLSFNVGLTLTLASVGLIFSGLKMLFDDSPENDLLGQVMASVGLALMGTSISLMAGKGLVFSISMGLAIASVELMFEGVQMLFDESDENDLMGQLTTALAGILGGTAVTGLTSKLLGFKKGIALGFAVVGTSIAFSGFVEAVKSKDVGDRLIQSLVTAVGAGLTAAGIAFAIGGAAAAGYAALITIPFAFVLTFTISSIVSNKKKDDAKIFDDYADNTTGNLVNSFNSKAYTVGGTIGKTFEDLCNEIENHANNEFNRITSELEATGMITFSEAGTYIAQGVADGVNGGKPVAIDSISGLSQDMIDEFNRILGINSPSKVFYDNAAYIIEGLVNGITENEELVHEAMSEFCTTMLENFTEFGDTFTENYAVYQESWVSMNQTMLDTLSAANEAHIRHVEATFKKHSELHLANLETFSQQVIAAHTRYQNTLRSNFNSWTASYLSAARTFVQKLSTIMAGVGGSAAGKNTTWMDRFTITAPGFASGGYPDEGQLFIARERGAEMVGSIGGRTAVANNDQIVEAIRQGVYDAEMAARSGDGGGDTYVYLDGEQIATRIEKRRKDNGLSIYSGGVM